jgi:hypothetical protein
MRYFSKPSLFIQAKTKKMRLLVLIISIFFSINVLGQQNGELSNTLLSNLTKHLISVKESDQYLNAELLQIFSENGKNYVGTQIEIERIGIDINNQKILFDYWYKKFDGSSIGIKRINLLKDYFQSRLYLSESDSQILSAYISNRNYLNQKEKELVLLEKNLARERYAKEEEIQSKIYNLAELDSASYAKFYNKIIQSLFTKAFSISDGSLDYHFVHYDSGQVNINAGINIHYLKNWDKSSPLITIETISGEKYFNLINCLPSDESYPQLTYDNIYITTKADFNNIKVEVANGYCEIKFTKKKMKIDYILYKPKNQSVANLIKDKLIGKNSGIYKVTYKVGRVNDKNIELVDIKESIYGPM